LELGHTNKEHIQGEVLNQIMIIIILNKSDILELKSGPFASNVCSDMPLVVQVLDLAGHRYR